ncbi:S1 family peptidase [Sciscionella marina]|uniref:S1 family peptidase n=1 Tax=Sciscionella marina TaxID=508770 RepID=UPI00039E43D5|nr:S1 family peptidase [Sciscionella marina]
MRGTRSRILAAAASAGAALLLAGFGTPASAAPASVNSVDLANSVANELGAASGGHYLDAGGKAVVGVVNKADEAKVRAAGAVPTLVKHTMAQLTAAKTSFDRLPGVTQAGWGIDPVRNQVVVHLYDATPAAAKQALQAKARSLGDKARVEHERGAMSLFIQGGDEISNGNSLCSNGFNVTKDGKDYLLSAGHCAVLGGNGDWNGGKVVNADFPTKDSMLVENNTGSAPSEINDGTKITSITDPTVGENMKRAGRTSGVTSGSVTELDYTFVAEGYTVYHEFCTNAHSAGGDSGGPAYDGGKGLGTLTGGDSSTSCFYPATLSTKDYGVSLPQ